MTTIARPKSELVEKDRLRHLGLCDLLGQTSTTMRGPNSGFSQRVANPKRHCRAQSARLLIFSLVGGLAVGPGEDRKGNCDHVDAVAGPTLGFAAGLADAPGDADEVADCFALLRRAATRPPRDILRLLDAAIFNLIIGNADAHAKNFNLLHRGGAITFTPLYDPLSTVLYPELSPKLAMKIGGKAALEDIEPRRWDRFAADAQLGAPFVRTRVLKLCDVVAAAIDGEFAKSVWGTANFSSARVIVRKRAVTLKDKFS